MNYLVLAMKRSGHHAIKNWIQAHTELPFYNNCCFGWRVQKLLTMVGKREAVNGIANIEDFNPTDWLKWGFPSFPFLENCKVVLVTRSINNWLASCYKRKFQGNDEWQDVYKYLMKPYRNDRKENSPSRIDLYYKHIEFAQKPEVIAIGFDEWFKSKVYRKDLAERLGFEFDDDTDLTRLLVPKNGGGSSFDGMKMDLVADKMKVLSRAEEFKTDKEFLEILEYAQPRAVKCLKKIGAI